MANYSIPESELILNSDGSVYHLHIHAEQLADTVITVGDPSRVEAVSKYFDRIEHKSTNREFVVHTGYIGSKRLTVLSTGIGTDNIDIVLNELDALVNIDLRQRTIKEQLKSLDIIRIGTCGGLQPELGLDSYVITREAIGMDGLLNFYEQRDRHYSSILLHLQEHLEITDAVCAPYIQEAAPSLLQLFGDEFIPGITVTCTGFYAPQGRQLRLSPSISGFVDRLINFRHEGQSLTNFEMETAGIYGLGKLLGHHCCSISTVVANRALHTFSSNYQVSVDRMIQKVLEKVGG
ncbi:MAG: nucleoside phosphorylase [Chitinophagales bacterium]|nr:nucleoside phosphorylase [Chitinophagales bacterium]